MSDVEWTYVHMGDGIGLYVPVGYRKFARRWGRAYRGTWSRRALMAFHRWIGISLRAHPRFMEVVCWDGGAWRRLWLNPRQIVLVMAA
jgi:hypothetical protein